MPEAVRGEHHDRRHPADPRHVTQNRSRSGVEGFQPAGHRMKGMRRRRLGRAAFGAVGIRRPHLVSALATKWHPLLHTKAALRRFRNIPRAGHANIFAMKLLLNAVLSVLVVAGLLPAAKNLEIYFIDVEGGQATLMLSPGGESMLIDTGWGGFNRRDAERIAA